MAKPSLRERLAANYGTDEWSMAACRARGWTVAALNRRGFDGRTVHAYRVSKSYAYGPSSVGEYPTWSEALAHIQRQEMHR